MIFIWFFKLVLFCLKKFVTYLTEFQVLIVLAVLFLILLFLIYRELKKGIKKIGSVRFSSEPTLFPDFWGFLSVIVPGLDKVSNKSVQIKIVRIPLN